MANKNPDKMTLAAMFDNRAQADRAQARIKAMQDTQVSAEITDSSATGSGSGSFADETNAHYAALAGYGFPAEDRYTYSEGLKRGACLLAIEGLSSSSHDSAVAILEEEGAVNLDEREKMWRDSGWSGYEGRSSDTAEETAQEDSIPIVEEQLRVGKRAATSGKVRLRSYTHEEPVSADVDLHQSRVEVERRPVDRAADATDAFRDRSVEAEEYTEEAVVSKEARVVEEVSLKSEEETRRETVSDTVRRTEVEVEDERRSDSGDTRR
jgi:uncharacterized protein (TIGR02271 family)